MEVAAWMQEGQRFQEWSKNKDQKRWEPRARSGVGRDLPFTFFVSEILDGLEREGSYNNEIQRPFLARKGDGCMKDTRNHPRHR